MRLSLSKMAVFYTVICILLSATSLKAFDISGFLGDDEEKESSLRKVSELVDKVYGSEELTEEKFWKVLNHTDHEDHWICDLDRVWIIDDFKTTVDAVPESILNIEEKTLLHSEADKDIAEELELSSSYSDQNCTMLYGELQQSRNNLDCVLSKHNVTEIFKQMFHNNDAVCWSFVSELWKTLLNVGEFPPECDATLVYMDVVKIAQISNEEYKKPSWNYDSIKLKLELSANLAASVSSPKHIEYLTRMACPEKKNPWDCSPVSTVVESLLCEYISMATVKRVEDLVKGPDNAKAFSNFDDAEISIEILGVVSDTVHIMTENNMHLTVESRTVKITTSTLDTYLDIMDRTIGISSKEMWSNVPADHSMKHLGRLLRNNEKYVWSMSRFYFVDDEKKRERTFNKSSMALHLSMINKPRAVDKLDFQFEDANIETHLKGDEAEEKLNVYAIHYKSWGELLKNHGFTSDGAKNNGTKYFVGSGGIISLSAHENNTKISVPVAYKMNFKSSDLQTGENRRVCLSCEYLNLTSGTWEDYGCTVSSVNDVGVTCKCNHTTNFAAFMSPVEIQYENDQQYKVQNIISYVGSAISVMALSASLVVFNIVRPSIRNDRLKAHMSLAFALLVVHVTQLAADLALYNDAACLISAVITHYFLLAAFFWMMIEGIFLYLYVVQVFVHSSIEYLRLIYVLGWILPGIIVIVSCAIGIPSNTYLDVNQIDRCNNSQAVLYPPLPSDHTYKKCWLSTESGMAFSFIVPALIIILINSIILAKVFQVLMRVTSKNRSKQRRFQNMPLSSGGHTNSAYAKKEMDDKTVYKSGSITTPTKTRSDGEKGYGATANGKTAYTNNGSHASTSSPVRYANNASRPRGQPSPLHDADRGSKNYISEVRTALKGALVLLPILGIPWICGLWAASNYVWTMFFLILNSTQGIFIFVIYCLMNGEVMRALKRHVKIAKLQSQSGRSRIGSTSSLKSLNSKFTWRSKSSSEK